MKDLPPVTAFGNRPLWISDSFRFSDWFYFLSYLRQTRYSEKKPKKDLCLYPDGNNYWVRKGWGLIYISSISYSFDHVTSYCRTVDT